MKIGAVAAGCSALCYVLCIVLALLTNYALWDLWILGTAFFLAGIWFFSGWPEL